MRTPVITIAPYSPNAIATVTSAPNASRASPTLTWLRIRSCTPLMSGTPGTMIIPGATRQSAGEPAQPSSTPNAPTLPLTSAAAKGMKMGLKSRRPSSWRSHMPIEPASHTTPNVPQSAPKSRARLAAVSPIAATTIQRE